MIKTLGFRGTAVKAGICFTVALGFVSASYGDSADVTVKQYEMQIFEGSTGGVEILTGDYSAAIESLRKGKSLDSKYVKNTNLCVAHTLKQDFSIAGHHCSLARKYSARALESVQFAPSGYLGKRNRIVVALNNLGVFHALQGNAEAAIEYFQAADRRGGRYSATSQRNIQALQQREEALVLASR